MNKLIVGLLILGGISFSQVPYTKAINFNDDNCTITPEFNGKIRSITEYICSADDTANNKRGAKCNRKKVFIDTNGNIHEYADYKGNRLTNRIVNKHNTNGHIVEKIEYDRNGKEDDRLVFHRDSNGAVVLVEYFENGKFDRKIEYGYYNNGLLAFEKHYANDSIIEYEIKDINYDKHENCIQYKRIENGDSPEIIIRDISYY